MLFRSHESDLNIAEAGCPWSLDGDASNFKLGAEAFRIHLAHLFDPLMAIHTSNVDPYPHQITAVYEAMLPKQPLRFVLADDPGAGKTIMAGLLIRELIVRGDLERCLIVAPGGLVDQWQDELDQKFNLNFEIFSRDQIESSVSSNPFEEKDFLIARIDQLARAEDLQEKLEGSEWDLIIVDEAHKMSATYFGNEFKRTKRYQLGEQLGRLTRHFLLMTATPHNGKPEDYQAFLALIDSDRFYGKVRDGAHQIDADDIMRRMVKEELVTFDNTPLFPERIAETVNYQLSDLEADLYAHVTDYVTHEMNRAQKLDDKKRGGTVGFALTILQRRLASSPEAIYQSLKRRFARLQRMLEEVKLNQRGLSFLGSIPQDIEPDDADDLYDEMTDDEREELENEVVDQATAARTIEELALEIESIKELVIKAEEVHRAGTDTKWQRLAGLLEAGDFMRDQRGNRHKLIIFTEHKDTLNYLYDKISTLLGSEDAIEVIHGGVKREDRRHAVAKFANYAECVILLATDAAGEGVNLQCAHLMVNYDLPWNPNRLEQRFGRIHRIGQQNVCRLWNLVANETREGDVFQRLFQKIEQERAHLKGKVFDILGEVFQETPLRKLLIEAIQYNDRPDVQARLYEKIESIFDHDNIEKIVERHALGCDHLDPGKVFRLKEEMQRAEAQRLQPLYVQAFFGEAFQRLGGDLKRREEKRFEITHVPASIRQRDRVIGNRAPVLKKYERVCYEKAQVRIPQRPMASLLAPGHPLMDATVDLILERYRPLLREGTILIDRNDPSETPRVFFIIDHSVKDGGIDKQGRQRVISRKLQFVFIDEAGNARIGGPAPYLDYETPTAEEIAAIEPLVKEDWISKDLEKIALGYAAANIVPGHFESIRDTRCATVEQTLTAVHDRLTREINYWTHRYLKLQDEVEAGKQPRMQPENARRRAEDLTSRLEHRTKELEDQRNVISAAPMIVGGALVVPQGWLDRSISGTAKTSPSSPETDPDQVARDAMEQIGMDAVMKRERELGIHPGRRLQRQLWLGHHLHR